MRITYIAIAIAIAVTLCGCATGVDLQFSLTSAPLEEVNKDTQ